MKTKNHTIVCLLFIGLFSSSVMISNVAATHTWGFEEGDTLLYYCNVGHNETINALGYVTYIIDDIDSDAETITITVEADFQKGENMIDYQDNINKDDVTITADYVLTVVSPIFQIFVLYESSYFADMAPIWQSIVDGLKTSYEGIGWTFESSVSNLGYEYHATSSDGDDLLVKRTYQEDGILKSYDYKREYPDGSTIIRQFEKCFLPVKLPIALPNIYVYIGLGVIGVLVLGVLMLACRKRKK